ncbi:DNA polymerase III, delta subunit [Pilibacter termitis]|uniref:DNA polymerase III subunit delta n=1 Tax=Pilibacter termitis TaxID=263852 RepID=A0A1T4PT81_9ENTE|nr:DNA polymerase III subunit delta [Pilibacter termitis]SJZ94854.1 DNA polymerase III, delta subunit [Pilibacter termitis]
MTIQNELMKIKKGEIAPVYLLFGTEEYLFDQVKQALEATLFPEGRDDMSFSFYDMNTTSLSEVVNDALELPFFAEKKLIFAEDSLFLTAKKVAKGVEHNVEELLEYLKSPSESTVLVFCVRENLDGKRKVVKALKKEATVLELSPLKEEEVRRYLLDFFKNEGISIDKHALEELLVRTHFSLTMAMNEARKVQVFVGDKGVATKEEITQLVAKTLDQDIFELTGLIFEGNADRALLVLEDLILQGESLIALNALFISQVRLFLQVKILLSEGFQQGAIASATGANPYRVKLAMGRVRRMDKRLLMEIFEKSVVLDHKMKSSPLDTKVLFQLFIMEICGKM